MICFLYELFQRKVNDCTTGPHCHKKKKKEKKKSLLDITNTVVPLPWSQAFKTADLIYLVWGKKIDLLEQIKNNLYMWHIFKIQQNNKAGMAMLIKVTEINKILKIDNLIHCSLFTHCISLITFLILLCNVID